jgi:tyrosine-protein phosphatase YwqE
MDWTYLSIAPPSCLHAASASCSHIPSARQECWRAAAACFRGQLAAGCVTQVSASSLMGAHGHEAQAAAWALVDYGLAHVIASDAHSARRAPCLEAGSDQLLAGGATFVTVRRLIDINPRELVAAGVPRRLPLAA